MKVYTAGHGGMYVPPEMLWAIPQVEQDYAAQWSGDKCWYEEDCAAAIVLYRLWDEVKDGLPHLDYAKAKGWYDGVKQYWEGKK